MSEPIVRGVVVDRPSALRGGDPERPVRITVADAAYADLTPHEARTVAAALEMEAATAGPAGDASGPTPPGEGHRTGTGGPDAPGASEGLDAAIRAAARAAYDLHVQKAVASRNISFDPAPWDRVSPDAQRPWLEEAKVAYDSIAPLLRQAVAEDIARRLIEVGRDPHRNLAWMYPEQAAEIAREVGRG